MRPSSKSMADPAMNLKSTKSITKQYITIFLILGGLEFFIAAGFIISEGSDPKNALFFGYSAARLFLIVITAISGAGFLFFARRIHQKGIPEQLQNKLNQHFAMLRILSIALFLVGVITVLIPSSSLGDYADFFKRILPTLIVVITLPFQFFVPSIFVNNRNLEKNVLRQSLIVFFMLAILAGFIALTKLGVTPDHYFWNVAGVPLSALELIIVLLITLIFFHTSNLISTSLKLSPYSIDIGIALVIYIAGVWIWSQTPMVKHFFMLRPAPPAFQYFPFSDARDLDLGSLSVINGYGINFGEYTDKPLYIIFLSVLHFFAGNDYNQLSLLHLYGMAFSLPAIYWLGHRFHSRQFGIAIALVILIRQRNAILLAHSLAGTNPRLLITELPTLLGIIILCNIIFSWLGNTKSSQRTWPNALLAGGILGALSLIRLNPIGLLPVIYVTILFALRKTGVKWFSQILIFTLGFLMVFTPWVLTGQDSNGQPYLWIKIRNVIAVRYPDMPSIEENDQAHLRAKMNYYPRSFPSLGKKGQGIPFEEFPFFVINHSLHNMVTSWLALPDSLSPVDQDLKTLIKRPYLDEKQIWTWNGKLEAGQVPFIALNLFFLAIGLGWSWSRWKWAGIFPTLVFITYTVTLGFARTSGSRYIVPIDWIVFFYYILGIIFLIEQFSAVFVCSPQNTRLETGGNSLFVSPIYTISIVLFLAMLVPIAQLPVITRSFPSCKSQVIDLTYEKLRLVKGKVLYPYLEKGSFYFMFFVCDQRIEINIMDFDVPLQQGQTIVIGFSKEAPTQPGIIFLEENSAMVPIWGHK